VIKFVLLYLFGEMGIVSRIGARGDLPLSTSTPTNTQCIKKAASFPSFCHNLNVYFSVNNRKTQQKKEKKKQR